MNKLIIQNILYAGHCIGICSDWSEQAVNEIIDKLKDDDFVYNKNIKDKKEIIESAINYIESQGYTETSQRLTAFNGFIAGYLKTMEE